MKRNVKDLACGVYTEDMSIWKGPLLYDTPPLGSIGLASYFTFSFPLPDCKYCDTQTLIHPKHPIYFNLERGYWLFLDAACII